jgi:hypothetical protein
MKFLSVLFIVCLCLIYSCSSDEQKITDATPGETQKILETGNQITSELLKSLKSELQVAIAEGGFEKAISICNLKAMPLTKIVENSSDKIISIKRTSYLYRNPLNAPDEVEKKALDHFRDLINKNSELPEYYIQKVKGTESTSYYFFKPMKIESLCLGCHGKHENMDASVLNQIAGLYPQDKAVGYKEGDFRGLVSVIIRE